MRVFETLTRPPSPVKLDKEKATMRSAAFPGPVGARPLVFSDAIVGATAVHFHYAGFVLPILTGLSARIAPGPSARIACVGVIAGVPLVAAGIKVAATDAASPRAVAGRQPTSTRRPAARRPLLSKAVDVNADSLCLALSAVALVVGMGCAALYAWGRLTGSELLSIPLMYRVHGAVNALGFALPGLIGWTLLATPTVRAGGVPPGTD